MQFSSLHIPKQERCNSAVSIFQNLTWIWCYWLMISLLMVIKCKHWVIFMRQIERCIVFEYFDLVRPQSDYCLLWQDFPDFLSVYSPMSERHRAIINGVVCLTAGPQPLPKRVLHTVQSSASHFKFQLSSLFVKIVQNLRTFSASSPVISIFPSVTCFRRQFLRKMWPIQLASFLSTIRRSLSISYTQLMAIFSL